MTDPAPAAPSVDPAPPPVQPAAGPPAAPSERGLGKLLIALALFLFVPMIPQVRAVLPIEQTMMLFVPALAACTLVGWWAGGRAFLAIALVAIAVLMAIQGTSAASGPEVDAFYKLVRGWSLLLAGAFGLVCLFGDQRPFLTRALVAIGVTLVLAAVISAIGPVTMSHASTTVAQEFARRNAETMTTLNTLTSSKDWQDLASKVPQFADMPAEIQKQLDALSDFGHTVFPALLALESLAALALAWATYHRLSRARLGAPLRPLREFRFNDQLVWGLIVGLTIVLLPTLTTARGAGKNLLVFFGAMYAMRGFGVLSWFMAPGSLGITLGVGFLLLFAPVLNAIAALVFMLLGVAALALGLGDTWADWRSRARSTTL